MLDNFFSSIQNLLNIITWYLLLVKDDRYQNAHKQTDSNTIIKKEKE